LTKENALLGCNPLIKDILNYFARISANNYKLFFIILLVGLALLVRIHNLDHESLWMDEIRQTSYYANSFSEIIDNSASQSQPPLDYWIGRFVHFFSKSDFAVRLPAAIFGTGSVLLLVMLISQITSWPVACGFGIISAFLPFNLYYSQEARPYAIAIFLFLCIFWSLNSFLSRDKDKKLFPVLTLLLFATFFLYSRSLSPLVISVSLLLILISWLFFLFLNSDPSAIPPKHLLILSSGALILALIFYLPSLTMILAKSARYVSDSSLGLNLENLISAIVKFDLMPLWQAYLVQSEPISYPLLFLVCLSPCFGWYLGLHRKNTIWALTTLLLPVASILNLVIFQTKSDMPFRSSYVSYILPLACILGAVSIQGIWALSAKVRFALILRGFVLIFTAFLTFQTLLSVIDYKTMRRKPDWRGITAFLAENYDTEHLLIFDSFSHYGSWEPTFYGFPRYYRGNSPIASIGRIPFHTPQMSSLPLSPILILFQWRDYYLTSQSPYPILSNGLTSIDHQKICRDPKLNCIEFTGFSLIQLREQSNSLAHDTYEIIERLLLHAPEGSWNVELHLAAAALARTNQLDQWHHHLMQAEGMVGGQHLPKVTGIAEHIRRIDPP
jgi:hypothetical protein